MRKTESLRALVRDLRLGRAEEDALVPLGHNWMADEDLAPLLSGFRDLRDPASMYDLADLEDEKDQYDSEE